MEEKSGDEQPKIAVVMPAYKSSAQIVEVIRSVPRIVSDIFVIDDCCPERTGQKVAEEIIDDRVQVHRSDVNLGVGGATKIGINLALKSGAEIIVKIDSDGQMNPNEIPKLVKPLLNREADYAKGNRFYSLDSIQEMPKVRILGNAVLSLFSKISSGYWTITDPTNGFLAITSGAAKNIDLKKVRNRWFFESDMLFRLYIIRAVVVDVPMNARYGDERSNLKVWKVLPEFLWRHNINLLKRILYSYYVREWGPTSILGPSGFLLLIAGGILGLAFLGESSSTGVPATAGQVMISVLPIILGFQLLLTALSSDITNEPKTVLYGYEGKSRID